AGWHRATLPGSFPWHPSFRHSAGLARRQASVGLQAETSEVASACGCGWPQVLTSWGAARGRGSASRPLVGSRATSPRPSRWRRPRSTASGWGRGRQAGSIRPSTAATSSPPTRRTDGQHLLPELLPLLVLRRQQDRSAARAPTAGSPPPPSTPDGPGFMTAAIPGPTLHTLVGSADQHPVAA